jgi:hypothetical protein
MRHPKKKRVMGSESITRKEDRRKQETQEKDRTTTPPFI